MPSGTAAQLTPRRQPFRRERLEDGPATPSWLGKSLHILVQVIQSILLVSSLFKAQVQPPGKCADGDRRAVEKNAACHASPKDKQVGKQIKTQVNAVLWYALTNRLNCRYDRLKIVMLKNPNIRDHCRQKIGIVVRGR